MRTQQIAEPRLGASLPRLRGIRAWLQGELAALGARPLWLALAALLVVFLLVPQLPLQVRIDVGYEEGIGSDLPYLQGFNTAERDELGSYRWTADGAQIRIPAVGRRPLLVHLSWLPMPTAVRDVSPHGYTLTAGTVSLGWFPLPMEGGAQHIVVPASAVVDGRLTLTFGSETFTLPGDPRTLGARLSTVTLVALEQPGLTLPDWRAALTWLAALVGGWLAIRHALGEGNRRAAGWVLAAGAGLVALAALLDPPRWAFGAGAALIACALAYPLALATRPALPRLADRLGVPRDAASLGWLAVLIIVSFGLRYGGRLYPDSMHGDLGFHHNRFNESVWGLITLVSVNRGVAFPYPPGPYMVVAPLTVIGLEPRTLLQLGAALADAVSIAVVYAIAARVARRRTALLAAGLYGFTAATFMTNWWAFITHIYTQFFHLLLIAALCWALVAWQRPARRPAHWWTLAVGVLLALVVLGHFGFLINTTLLVAGLTAVVWLQSWRGAGWARQVRGPLTLALAGAGAVAVIFFYSSYIPMFLGQIQTAREGGLTAVAGRGPVSRAIMWQRLWWDGFVVHFGLFPLLLMPWGLWRLWRAGQSERGAGPRRTVLWLALGSLAVAAIFAVFPFVAGVTNSPRWLLFIAWIVALGAALAAEALWHRGWWGRLALVAMGAVVLANSAWIWIGPMLWRIRPPEPF